MALITGSIKDVLSIKIKNRHDDYTDQFSRIFMVKMFIISSLIMGVDFFSDKVSCIVPQESSLSRDFVHSACWIQGFYIYEELHSRMLESGYYGIPKDIEHDGMAADGTLCSVVNKATHLINKNCIPMTKMFFLQYQYFPFYIASLAILYYVPYMMFRIINGDIINLRGYLKEKEKDGDPQKVVENYFDYNFNGGKSKLRRKILLNMATKLAYVFVNVLGLVTTNVLLNDNYLSYGLNWVEWSRLNNTFAFEYNHMRQKPKPGNYLLPPMGFCEITEGSKDVRTSFTNQNKFICEISPNVLYQYVLVVLWFFFVISITMASLGVIFFTAFHLVSFLKTTFAFFKKKPHDFYTICEHLTLREIEYLKFMQTKNSTLYGDVMKILSKRRAVGKYTYELSSEKLSHQNGHV